MSDTVTELDVEESPTGDGMDEAVPFEDLIKINEQRERTYAMLARIYRKEIDQAYLDELRAINFPVETGDDRSDEGNHLIARFMSNLNDESVDDLARDFVRCFIGQGMSSFETGYPYESVYTSEKRLLLQEARDEVLAVYRSEGLDKNEDWVETEDHLAAELEFMQILVSRTVKALKDNDEDRAVELLTKQRDFLADHLNAWVPMLVMDMRKFAQTDFYQGAALLTEGFLQIDQDSLEDLLAEEGDEDE